VTEYIIINKTVIQQRIEELENERKKLNRFIDTTTYTTLDNLIKQLQNILSQSTPLIPEIEKAFVAGFNFEKGWKGDYPNKKDYISNLKLDI
jgi:hypothetical protein